MRVTMLVRCLAMMRGGGETRHLAWMRELSRMGTEVDVIAGQPLALGGARFPIEGVKATIIRSPYLRDWVYRFQRTRGFGRLTMDALHVDEEWFCRAAWREIAARPNPPDIVHAHALYQAARLRRGSSAVVLNFPGEPNPRYAADIRQADALIADGWAARHLPAALGLPVHAVPKGVDVERFRPTGSNLRAELGLDGKRVILSVARFVPIKNVTLLVDAMAIMAERDALAHLLLVGEGPELRGLRAHVDRLGLQRRVTFAGHVRHDQLPPFYRTADLFALASEFDNSPNVVLEAMACGLAVVATDVGGVSEYVAAVQGGELVPARDASALAGALGTWLDDAPRRREAAAFNRQRTVQQFSWRVSAERLLDVYNRVLSAPQQQASA
ncbi:MAG TPA: glycosyltransferase family 4 protein [Vicinamibacterales bacterium]|nr:glycosyltransferase family 4 protein [Vicinamibacterales bacterium]